MVLLVLERHELFLLRVLMLTTVDFGFMDRELVY